MHFHALVCLAVGACSLVAVPASAQQKNRAAEFEKTLRNGLDDFLAQRGEEKEDRKLAKMMAERVADAAHPTNRGLNLKSFRVEQSTRRNPKTAVVLDVVYFGLQTPAGYTAEIKLVFQPCKAGWSVSEIQFRDQRNAVPADAEGLTKLKETLNDMIEQWERQPCRFASKRPIYVASCWEPLSSTWSVAKWFRAERPSPTGAGA